MQNILENRKSQTTFVTRKFINNTITFVTDTNTTKPIAQSGYFMNFDEKKNITFDTDYYVCIMATGETELKKKGVKRGYDRNMSLIRLLTPK